MIDDESDITFGIKRCIENEYYVDAFNDPVAALDNFSLGKYDIILIDVKMPKMNGFELYRTMQRIDSGACYCFITAFEIRPVEFKRMFPSSSVCYFLKKPFSSEELLKLLNVQIEEKKNLAESATVN